MVRAIHCLNSFPSRIWAATPGFPFFLAGTLKIVDDVVLYRQLVTARPPEEIRH
jgi:hypothetical protein